MKNFVFFAAAAIFALQGCAQKEIPQKAGESAFRREKTVSDGANDFLPSDEAQEQISPSFAENFVLSQNFDLDGDSFEDAVWAVLGEKGEISLEIGLYNKENGSIDRHFSFDTPIADPQSLEFSFLDLVGDHTFCVVATGAEKSGKSALLAVRVEVGGDVKKIAQIECDGAISPQSAERLPSYSKYMSKGESFAIAAVDSQNRQTIYEWDSALGCYQKAGETALPASRSNAAKKIGAMTVKERTRLLDGLWYLTSGTESESRCLFFDSNRGEVSFAYSDGEEVFWVKNERARRDGASLLIQNSIVGSLTRRCEISFLSEDEIQVKVSDNVRMSISEDTLWSGLYRRQTRFEVAGGQKSAEKIQKIFELLDGSNWTSADGMSLSLEGGRFSLLEGEKLSEGRAAVRQEGETVCIQFRSEKKDSLLDGQFAAEIEEADGGISLSLTPVTQTSRGIVPTGRLAIAFSKG